MGWVPERPAKSFKHLDAVNQEVQVAPRVVSRRRNPRVVCVEQTLVHQVVKGIKKFIGFCEIFQINLLNVFCRFMPKFAA